MVKMCKLDLTKRCYWSSCSSLDVMGNVVVCCLVPNPSGFFMRKKVVSVGVSLSSKHLRSGS